MRNLILIGFILCSFTAISQRTKTHNVIISSGGVNGSLASGGGSIKWYSILDYGALASSVSIQEFRVATCSNKINVTSNIQATINACHAGGGGKVYIPHGHYYTGQLESYADVTIVGDGFMASFLHALSDTTLTIHNSDQATAGGFGSSLTNNDLVRGVRFQGDSVGKVGIYFDRVANFNITQLYFEFYLTTGMILYNSLIGTVSDCRFYYNTRGVVGYSNPAYSASNHVTFYGCVINVCKKWALDWANGGLLSIDFCDFEGNGSNGDTTTGSIYYHDNPWPKGVNVSNTWFEENQGTNIFIGPNVSLNNFNQPGPTTHNMYGNNDQGHHYDFLNRNIYIKGDKQQLNIYSCMIWGASGGKNIVVDGTNNIVKTYGVVWSNNNVGGVNNVVRQPASSSITNN